MKLSRLLTLLAVLIFCLITIGGMVRNLGAGLSCPDWPLCNGKIVPDFDIKIFAEYFHRVFAGGVSILTLVLFVMIFVQKNLRKSLGGLAVFALLLLASQVILGGLTVLQLLKSEIVTLHLATGTAFFSTIIVMSLRARSLETLNTVRTSESFELETRTAKINSSLLKLWPTGLITVSLVYLQIILGGVVSSHYAGLACPDFPTCLGHLWPTIVTGNVVIQMTHRLGATAVFVAACTFVYQLLRSQILKFSRLGILIFLALLAQIALGIGNVVFRLPVALSVGHLAVAEVLFALVLIALYEIHLFKLRQSH